MKRIILMILTVIMLLALPGCEEMERTDTVRKEKEAVIEENVDLSGVYSPAKVSVYSARFWEEETEDIVDIFFDGKYTEKGAEGEGEWYILASDSGKGKKVCVYDGGMSFFGHIENGMQAGLMFADLDVRMHELFPEEVEISTEYFNSGRIYSRGLDETDDTLTAAKQEIEGYLEKLGMENYVVDDAAVFENEKDTGYLIYWRQVFDSIPLSDVYMNSGIGQEVGRKVYNSTLSYNKNMGQSNSTLTTEFVNGSLVDLRNTGVISIQEKLKEYPVISVSEAYKKVEERYQKFSSDICVPALERAELQYKCIEFDENIYLYPVWTFCVKTEEEKFSDGTPNVIWNYYLIDAVTGDYFMDIDTEDLVK